MTVRQRHLALLFTAVALAGCGHSPSFNVLGSYFPGWIASILIAVLLTAIVRLLLRRLRFEPQIPLLPLFYVSFALLVACLLWLVTFE